MKAFDQHDANGPQSSVGIAGSFLDAKLFEALMPSAHKTNWSAIVLAGSRGPNDPMTKAYGVLHKCLIDVAGQPMLRRVVQTLKNVSNIDDITVAMEDPKSMAHALGNLVDDVGHVMPGTSAASSALRAVEKTKNFPILITTGDHPLLTAEMVSYTLRESTKLNADITVAVAAQDVIAASYPETKRTYFPLANRRVSGCNLFTVHTERGLNLVKRWHALEQNRKRPYHLIAAFGLSSVFSFVTGRLTLDRAFEIASGKVDATIKPLLLPFAEAAIDVDKPSDKDMAEMILQRRMAAE
jgi:GTP:adenosylcobinamide-phosphate guanylyltransferase